MGFVIDYPGIMDVVRNRQAGASYGKPRNHGVRNHVVRNHGVRNHGCRTLSMGLVEHLFEHYLRGFRTFVLKKNCLK